MTSAVQPLKNSFRTEWSEGKYPSAVYRLNFNRFFTFDQAARLAAYLHELGISHCYASPLLKAGPGSTHGYDVSDPNVFNPEIGTLSDFYRFIRHLHRRQMGLILDFVPNHMSLFDNEYWNDVLENGRAALSAAFFDIDWSPPRRELKDRVLLPVLENDLETELLSGQIRLEFIGGQFLIVYAGRRFPVDPGTLTGILGSTLRRWPEQKRVSGADRNRLRDLIAGLRRLPDRNSLSPVSAAARRQALTRVKTALADLFSRDSAAQQALQEQLTRINRGTGDKTALAELRRLLDEQVYLLDNWRQAGKYINYRRFCDINDLVALRMEDPAVFEGTHRLVRRLISTGAVDGLRLDHVDGLYDPLGYLERLQQSVREDTRASLQPDAGPEKQPVGKSLREDSHSANPEGLQPPGSECLRPLYIVVEKILSENEALEPGWPVAGTTGYEFLDTLNRLLIDPRGLVRLRRVYREFTGCSLSFQDIVYSSKHRLTQVEFEADIERLTALLARLRQSSRTASALSVETLREAICRLIAALPVYRTYLAPEKGTLNKRDKVVLINTLRRAQHRNPGLDPAVWRFLRDLLGLKKAVPIPPAAQPVRVEFIRRWQQTSAPVMAKGLEDTALYIYHPLLSLNDVGASPLNPGISPLDFHRRNLERQARNPLAFITTSTHDTKRSEDVRARLNVLSEIPLRWAGALRRWSEFNQAAKTRFKDTTAPDRNEEYLLYQTLLGSWPLPVHPGPPPGDYLRRVQEYMLKALREASLHSCWQAPDRAYEECVSNFLSNLWQPSGSDFQTDFFKLLTPLAECGIYNAITQTLLKIFAPGVPDIYQGNEFWTFDLTDPDNRRPVDFAPRTAGLKRLRNQALDPVQRQAVVRRLFQNRTEGTLKLYITWLSLNYRRRNSALFREGTYTPLEILGKHARHVCAPAWQHPKQCCILAVPRLPAGLTRLGTRVPLGEAVWKDTRLILPEQASARAYQDLFSGRIVETTLSGGRRVLLMAQVFALFPAAVLEPVS